MENIHLIIPFDVTYYSNRKFKFNGFGGRGRGINGLEKELINQIDN
jgi:hypothetical protein